LNEEIVATLLVYSDVLEDLRQKYAQLRLHSSLSYKPAAPETFKLENLIVVAAP
jgi:hypothetical protein